MWVCMHLAFGTDGSESGGRGGDDTPRRAKRPIQRVCVSGNSGR